MQVFEIGRIMKANASVCVFNTKEPLGQHKLKVETPAGVRLVVPNISCGIRMDTIR